MKKLLAFVLVAIISLSMVACQNTDNPGDTSGTQPSGNNTSETSNLNLILNMKKMMMASKSLNTQEMI